MKSQSGYLFILAAAILTCHTAIAQPYNPPTQAMSAISAALGAADDIARRVGEIMRLPPGPTKGEAIIQLNRAVDAYVARGVDQKALLEGAARGGAPISPKAYRGSVRLSTLIITAVAAGAVAVVAEKAKAETNASSVTEDASAYQGSLAQEADELLGAKPTYSNVRASDPIPSGGAR